MGYFYTLSIQPMKRSEKYGDKAWKDCKKFRSIGGLAEFISIANLILWIWFPLPVINEWIISSNIWIGIKMYSGIYNYIRHPQTLGEFPMFIAMSFMFNSWFLVILSSLFIIIYTPIMIHYEEIDLVRRFGEKYTEYQKRTGALFPKLKKASKSK
jgi:protein-S-isoprenylcysteine O-methyltransferase Ste14